MREKRERMTEVRRGEGIACDGSRGATMMNAMVVERDIGGEFRVFSSY